MIIMSVQGNYVKLGKKLSKDLEGIVSSAHTEPGIVNSTYSYQCRNEGWRVGNKATMSGKERL